MLFLYQKVLGVDVPWMDDLARPVPKKRIPVVLTRAEVQAVLGKLDGQHKLLASLLYGCGMRLMEGLRLRVKDVDFDRKVSIVRDGKGGKDRVVMLPQSLVPALKDQFAQSHALWAQDRADSGYVPGSKIPLSTVSICVRPQNAIVRSSSLWMISSALVTPASPKAPRPYKNARPM